MNENLSKRSRKSQQRKRNNKKESNGNSRTEKNTIFEIKNPAGLITKWTKKRRVYVNCREDEQKLSKVKNRKERLSKKRTEIRELLGDIKWCNMYKWNTKRRGEREWGRKST